MIQAVYGFAIIHLKNRLQSRLLLSRVDYPADMLLLSLWLGMTLLGEPATWYFGFDNFVNVCEVCDQRKMERWDEFILHSDPDHGLLSSCFGALSGTKRDIRHVICLTVYPTEAWG
jgi:hypothetical protein